MVMKLYMVHIEKMGHERVIYSSTISVLGASVVIKRKVTGY